MILFLKYYQYSLFYEIDHAENFRYQVVSIRYYILQLFSLYQSPTNLSTLHHFIYHSQVDKKCKCHLTIKNFIGTVQTYLQGRKYLYFLSLN